MVCVGSVESPDRIALYGPVPPSPTVTAMFSTRPLSEPTSNATCPVKSSEDPAAHAGAIVPRVSNVAVAASTFPQHIRIMICLLLTGLVSSRAPPEHTLHPAGQRDPRRAHRLIQWPR